MNIPGQIKLHENLDADNGNAYLEATTKEKLYIVAGPEFEELQGHILVIHKGLKSAGLRRSQRIHDIMLQSLSMCMVTRNEGQIQEYECTRTVNGNAKEEITKDIPKP